MSLIIPANSASASGGYAVDNSCRFNSGSNDHLNRTQTAGNRRKFTFSTWVKRCNPATRMALFLANRSDSNYDQFFLHEDGILEADFYHSGTQIFRYKTNALYRDPSAWYHIIMAVDTEHDTASSRVRIYVNGLEVTSFSTETNPSENVDTHVNENSIVAYIGSDYNSNEPDYYLAETVMLDGTQATPTDFGEFDEDSGIWKPIDVSGLTFGTNGFYLDYEDSGALGDDVSGNGNDFTVNNLTAIDQSTDTCTNNFATFNPLIPQAEIAYSEGNLIATDSGTGGNSRTALSTIAPSSGKWYAEFKLITDGGDYPNIGIWSTEVAYVVTQNVGLPDDTYAWNNGSSGRVFSNNTTIGSTGVGTYAEGNIVQIALDLDNNYIYFGVNGTYITSGDPTSGASGTGGFAIASGLSYYFATTTNTNGAWGANFGGSPPYAISSGNTDGDGYGNFEYEVPSGYYALNTKNLAEYG